ncbi:MAG: SIMPL domain-containing protein, partial [Syntrophobacteria bacterium]
LTPVYDKDNRFQPRGYRVTNTVIMETKEIDQVGTFIDEASKAGVSRIGSLTFSTDGEEKLRKEAAVQAVNQAKDIAADLAKAAGLTIKKIVKLSYTPRGPAPILRMEAMAAAARTPIEVGEITLEETVHVIFEAN